MTEELHRSSYLLEPKEVTYDGVKMQRTGWQLNIVPFIFVFFYIVSYLMWINSPKGLAFLAATAMLIVIIFRVSVLKTIYKGEGDD